MKKSNTQRNNRADKVENHFKPADRLEPLNQLQSEYLECLRTMPFTFATGYAGTGKTYLAARLAARWYKQGAISKIILLRPAVSASQSLGFFKGTREEKMKQWLNPILGALKEEFSPGQLEYMMKEDVGALEFCPLETVKGNSWKDAFIIVDEAEDCTFKELKSLLTRLGTNSTMAICGDVNQTDLEKSGTSALLQMRENDDRLKQVIGWVDFNHPEDIVRSLACKEIILGFERAGL